LKIPEREKNSREDKNAVEAGTILKRRGRYCIIKKMLHEKGRCYTGKKQGDAEDGKILYRRSYKRIG
jgi:hypothetical protein